MKVAVRYLVNSIEEKFPTQPSAASLNGMITEFASLLPMSVISVPSGGGDVPNGVVDVVTDAAFP